MKKDKFQLILVLQILYFRGSAPSLVYQSNPSLQCMYVQITTKPLLNYTIGFDMGAIIPGLKITLGLVASW